MQVPAGMQESQRFEGGAIWTPSTKAEQGEHDENISKAKAVEIVGEEVAKKIEQVSLEIYKMVSLHLRRGRSGLVRNSPICRSCVDKPIKAHDYALPRGIIIADTKLEFGIDKTTGEIILVDEVLTPDSSRFWPADKYEVGKGQDSYDKVCRRRFREMREPC
jgi:phosphoribosylaminoimidazole-succinocarboxamide synthase